jgi:hypothetical protein
MMLAFMQIFGQAISESLFSGNRAFSASLDCAGTAGAGGGIFIFQSTQAILFQM